MAEIKICSELSYSIMPPQYLRLLPWLLQLSATMISVPDDSQNPDRDRIGLPQHFVDDRNRSIKGACSDLCGHIDDHPALDFFTHLRELANQGDDSLEAALRIAGQKYGGKVDITGSSEFRERAAREAARLNIHVLNNDLQAIVQDEIGKRRKPKTHRLESDMGR